MPSATGREALRHALDPIVGGRVTRLFGDRGFSGPDGIQIHIDPAQQNRRFIFQASAPEAMLPKRPAGARLAVETPREMLAQRSHEPRDIGQTLPQDVDVRPAAAFPLEFLGGGFLDSSVSRPLQSNQNPPAPPHLVIEIGRRQIRTRPQDQMEMVRLFGVKTNVDREQPGQLPLDLLDHLAAILVVDPRHRILTAEPGPLHAAIPAMIDPHFSFLDHGAARRARHGTPPGKQTTSWNTRQYPHPDSCAATHRATWILACRATLGPGTSEPGSHAADPLGVERPAGPQRAERKIDRPEAVQRAERKIDRLEAVWKKLKSIRPTEPQADQPVFDCGSSRPNAQFQRLCRRRET